MAGITDSMMSISIAVLPNVDMIPFNHDLPLLSEYILCNPLDTDYEDNNLFFSSKSRKNFR
ncbi:MAG: hypothetical protein HWQ41_05010 [Nostoc sp. NOS(2021)]|nr:hypothetical protein [Nostoc sp. NOS(2021)]